MYRISINGSEEARIGRISQSAHQPESWFGELVGADGKRIAFVESSLLKPTPNGAVGRLFDALLAEAELSGYSLDAVAAERF